jgi:flagellin-like hook-associated protein FlgL
MTRTRTLAAALVAGIALVAAGCGGDDESESAATQWAGDVCTAVNTWRSDITTTASSVTSNPTRAALEEAANDAKSTTETLVDTLKGLGAPDTESGDQARGALDTLSTGVQGDVDAIQKAVQDVSGVQGLLGAVSEISAALTNISSQLSDALDELGSLRDVDAELRQAFSDAESCDGLLSAAS